ncbi:MAG: putative toxin-antitoxin system toxin component, PIN family [Nitrososphaerota archaeon]|nr:putative toxin-antitoxin system toxin component, PIN family [Nitrososphaerota archaeon]
MSALIRPGKPRELWNRVLEQKIEFISSTELLLEFEDVIARPRFKKYLKQSNLTKFHNILLQNVHTTSIKYNFDVIKEDEDDNLVLETGYSGRVDYIVSGDEHLLGLKSFKGMKILNINEMLEILKE